MYEDIILNAPFVFQCFSVLVYAKDRTFVVKKLSTNELQEFKQAVRSTVDTDYL